MDQDEQQDRDQMEADADHAASLALDSYLEEMTKPLSNHDFLQGNALVHRLDDGFKWLVFQINFSERKQTDAPVWVMRAALGVFHKAALDLRNALREGDAFPVRSAMKFAQDLLKDADIPILDFTEEAPF